MMDTSPEYIKQCEKAEEIQTYFTTPLPPGTFWARKSESYYSEGVTGYDYKRLPEWVILPRQDQLQEMVSNHYSQTEVYFERTTEPTKAGFILRQFYKFYETTRTLG